MSDYIRCPNCGQMVHNMARVCPYCGSMPPTTRNIWENAPPYAIAGAFIGFTLGGVLFVLFGVSIFKAIFLSLVFAAISTVIVNKQPPKTQEMVAVLAMLPFLLIAGGILLFFVLAFLWAIWTV